ncbi:DUF2339 domain-containing protein [Actinomyces trachealis]|uniref:DUF2339 domain-containing protein n=1 Tax=Actinomyces trachealis TaxID=2763540 RepID=UPI001892C0C8|nr:DUF2339 domain-containing protein [Actinomyces trachealis]
MSLETDANDPRARREERPVDLSEVLRRLDVLDRKIDWIARRVSPAETAVAERSAAPVAAAPARSAAPVPATAHRFAPPTAAAPSQPRPSSASPFAAPTATPRPAADPFIRPTAANSSQPQPMPTPRLVGPVGTARPVAPASSGWWSQARSEGNIGRYVLSGAAALLVLLAAVTLIAYVWDSIPNTVKVVALGVVSISLVGGGTLLGRSRPRQAVAAATLTGTGGALGFVTVIGAVLLDTGLGSLNAFGLMSLWGVVLLLVSRMAAQGFTSVISALGGLVTVGFSADQVRTGAADAVQTWAMVALLIVVLAITSAVLLRMRAETTALVRPASPVALGAILMAPLHDLASSSAFLVLLLMLVPVATLYAEAIDDALVPNQWRLPAGFGIGAAGLMSLVVASQLLAAPWPQWRSQHGPAIGAAGVLLLLTALTMVLLLLRPSREGWRRPSVIAHLVVVAVVSGVSVLAEPTLSLLAAAAIVIAALPAVSESLTFAVLTPTVIMVLTVFQQYRVSSIERLGQLIALLVAVAAAPMLEAQLLTVPVQVPVMPPVGWVPPTTAQAGGHAEAPGMRAAALAQRRRTLLAATWVLAAALVVALPVIVSGWLEGQEQASFPTLLAGGVGAALVLVGLFRQPVTPLELIRGQALSRPVPASPAPTPLAWLGFAASGLLGVSQLTVTRTTGVVWDGAHVVMALGLAVLAVRVLSPWIRRTAPLMASAVLLTVVTCASVLTLADTGMQSVLMTITILATGSVCIVLGFKARLTMLRHYGLVLVLVSVLKLAVLDIGDQSPLTRILALLTAGLVCFGLSLAYNKVANDASDAAQASRANGPQPGSGTQPVSGPQAPVAPPSYGLPPQGTGHWQPPQS